MFEGPQDVLLHMTNDLSCGWWWKDAELSNFRNE